MPVCFVSIYYYPSPRWKKKKVGGRTYLIIDVMEDVFPERIQNANRYQEPPDAHPETVSEGDDG